MNQPEIDTFGSAGVEPRHSTNLLQNPDTKWITWEGGAQPRHQARVETRVYEPSIPKRLRSDLVLVNE